MAKPRSIKKPATPSKASVGKRVQRSYSKDLANRSQAASAVRAQPAPKVKGGMKVKAGPITSAVRKVGGFLKDRADLATGKTPSSISRATETYGRVDEIVKRANRR
jgi:hypothetical protein